MKKINILVCFLFLFFQSFSQNSGAILERKISVKIIKQTQARALTIIEETGGFHFSYNSNVLSSKKIVTVVAENRKVREVLDQLFNNELSYQQIGSHLILQKKPTPKTNSIDNKTGVVSKYNYTITGYIRDAQTGDGIASCSIYEKQTLSSAVSSDFGYYQLAVSSKNDFIYLKYTKSDYRDTVVGVRYQNNGLCEVHLSMENLKQMEIDIPVDSPFIPSPVLSDTLNKVSNNDVTVLTSDSSSAKKFPRIEDTKAGKWLIGTVQKLNEMNIRDSFERDWQITFVPPICSNGELSGLVQNKLSFNILAGYNGSVNGAEFGGFLNVLRKDMKGAQFSGLGNIVGGDVRGGQFSGFFNHNLGAVEGIQAAGFYNYNHGNTHGAQFAGFANINRSKMHGVQGAGAINVSKHMEGIQMAGFMNINESMMGVQLAGFMNINKDIHGFQAAGFMNVSSGRSISNQIAGFMNISKQHIGGQIAGFMNIAKSINGYQIGVINIADSAHGVVFGIFNFIRNGLHQVEVSVNDQKQWGLAYRSGLRNLYSTAMLNMYHSTQNDAIYSYGFGFGKYLNLYENLRLNPELSCSYLMPKGYSNYLNLQNRLSLSLELPLMKGIAVFGGATLNHLINDQDDPYYWTIFDGFGRTSIWGMQGRYRQNAFMSYQVGLRLFNN